MPATETTSIHRPWLIKQLIMIAAFQGFGFWFLYDATIMYPDRGHRFAQHQEMEYLRQADEANRLATAGVADPVAEYERLSELKDADAITTNLDAQKYTWLRALAVVNKLDPAETNPPNTRERLEELNEEFGTSSAPKPLNSWDIPVQWLIFVLCTLLALWMILVLIKAMAKKYRWDPHEERLVLPGGASIVASDIEEFDKRKWHKFFVTLKIRESVDRIGGKSVTMDLLRYRPLEDWIVIMDPDAEPAEEAETAEGTGTQDGPASAE